MSKKKNRCVKYKNSCVENENRCVKNKNGCVKYENRCVKDKNRCVKNKYTYKNNYDKDNPLQFNQVHSWVFRVGNIVNWTFFQN